MMRHATTRLVAWSTVWLVPALTLATTTVARADTHFAIISAEHTTPHTTAHLEVAVFGEPDAAMFTVFAADGTPVSDTLPANPNFFVSSTSSTNPEIANLFTGSGAAPALVRVQLSQTRSFALLHQSSQEGKVTVNVPPLEEARGVRFLIPIGDLQRGTVLLVGNPNDQPCAIGMRYGTLAPEPDRVLPAFGAIAIDVTNTNTLLFLEAKDATLMVIAQLAIDTGKTEVIALTPLQ